VHRFIKDWGALAAAAIIAIATVWGINLTQRGEDRRAEKRVEQQARGAARALIYELRDSAAYMDYLLNGLGHWEPLDERFPIRLPQEDMELIEARLDGAQYEAVSRALAGVASTEDRVRQVGPGRRRSRFVGDDAYRLHVYFIESAAAQNALADVADLDRPGDKMGQPYKQPKKYLPPWSDLPPPPNK
jgi:hypothetical protein